MSGLYSLAPVGVALAMVHAGLAAEPAVQAVSSEAMICKLWEAQRDYVLTDESKATLPVTLAFRYDLKPTAKRTVFEADEATYQTYDPDGLLLGTPANLVHKFLDTNEYMAGSGMTSNDLFSTLMVDAPLGEQGDRLAKLAKSSLKKKSGPGHYYAGRCQIVMGSPANQAFEDVKASGSDRSEK